MVNSVSDPAIRLVSCFGNYLARIETENGGTSVIQIAPYLGVPAANWFPYRPRGYSRNQVMLTSAYYSQVLHCNKENLFVTVDSLDAVLKDPCLAMSLCFIWNVHVVEKRKKNKDDRSFISKAISRLIEIKPQFNNNVAAPSSRLVNTGQNINGSGEQNNGDAIVDVSIIRE